MNEHGFTFTSDNVFGLPYSSVKGKPNILVSSNGIANGLSNIPNDGADFGPDTLQADGSATQTSGIQEMFAYSAANGGLKMILKDPTAYIINEPLTWNYAAPFILEGAAHGLWGGIQNSSTYFNIGTMIIPSSTFPWNIDVNNGYATSNILTINTPSQNELTVYINNIGMAGYDIISDPSLSNISRANSANFVLSISNQAFTVVTNIGIYAAQGGISTAANSGQNWFDNLYMAYLIVQGFNQGDGFSRIRSIRFQSVANPILSNSAVWENINMNGCYYNLISATDNGCIVSDLVVEPSGGSSSRPVYVATINSSSAAFNENLNVLVISNAFIFMNSTDYLVYGNGANGRIIFSNTTIQMGSYANRTYWATGSPKKLVLYLDNFKVQNNVSGTDYTYPQVMDNISGLITVAHDSDVVGQPPSTPSVPASGTAQQNTNPYTVKVYVNGGALTEIQITIGSTAYTVYSNSTASAVYEGFTLPAGASITLTYTTAPTWSWVPE